MTKHHVIIMCQFMFCFCYWSCLNVCELLMCDAGVIQYVHNLYLFLSGKNKVFSWCSQTFQLLWRLKVHYQGSLLVLILNQVNAFHTLHTCFPRFYFNIILPCVHRFSDCSLPSGFHTRFFYTFIICPIHAGRKSKNSGFHGSKHSPTLIGSFILNAFLICYHCSKIF